ncbi:ABC transporter ATP-binding protein [Volucribacter amazonae]|uniref:ABC transporter n=1 Tax=Volucribacter amazonae TaxID=256731 RepID=A0A9X4SJ34_9PAST|nr:ABC transporter ATP-binding protein [Volucribacter amazonae]MDG6896340.1 ABC transporter [Volucribacter amazonae]
MSVLQINQLTCQYGNNPILSGLNLTLEDNDILCLLGASGCGKTTLLKAIAGLLPAQQGSIHLAGKDLTQVAVEHRHIGLIFQDYALFPHLTVQENIAFGLTHLSADKKQKTVEKMTALVRLDGLLQRYPHQLSGGQQQRVAIARALACQPRLLLLDEPFSNIDSQVRQEMITEIRSILKQQHIPAIFVTHSKEEAFAFADKIAIMQQGKILQLGIAQQLYENPINKFVADFLGHCNYLVARYHSANQIETVLGFHHNPEGFYYTDGTAIDPQKPLYCLLRPQHIQLQLDPQGKGVIVDKLFVGYFYQYKVHIHQQQIDVQHYQSFEIGSKVTLSCVHQSLCLLAENCAE